MSGNLKRGKRRHLGNSLGIAAAVVLAAGPWIGAGAAGGGVSTTWVTLPPMPTPRPGDRVSRQHSPGHAVVDDGVLRCSTC